MRGSVREIIASRRFWLLIVFAAAFAVTIGFLQQQHSYFLEASIDASRAETARLFYDSRRGARASAPYRHEPGSSLYRFPIATGSSRWMNLAPVADQGKGTVRDAKIVDRRGNLVLSLPPERFMAEGGLQVSIPAGESEIHFEKAENATDASFEIRLDAPLHLPRLSFSIMESAVPALPAFFILLAGGLLAGFGPALARNGVVPGTAPASRFRDLLHTGCSFIRRHQMLIILCSATLILVLRLPDRFFNPQFWAEDAYFYMQARAHGVRSLFLAYGGYQLLVPRLAEFVALKIPLEHVPLFLNFTALLVALGVIARTLSSRNPLRFKPALAFAIVLVPRPEDIFLTIENTQWLLAVGLILLLTSEEPRTFPQRLYDYLATVLCGLTGVFSVLLFPLFAGRVVLRRTSHSTLLLLLVGITAAVQTWFVFHAPQLYSDRASPLGILQIPAAVGYQMFARLFGAEWIPHMKLLSLAIVGVSFSLYWMTLLWNEGKTRSENLRRLLLPLAGIIVCAASLYRFKNVLNIFISPENIARYFFVPHVVLVWLLLQETVSTSNLRRHVACVFLCAYAWGAVSLFREDPLWNYDWRKSVEQIRQGENVSVPVNPPGWYFQYVGKPPQ